MTRYSARTDEMRCAYCGVKRPWHSEHFPDRTYAMCTWCVMEQTPNNPTNNPKETK